MRNRQKSRRAKPSPDHAQAATPRQEKPPASNETEGNLPSRRRKLGWALALLCAQATVATWGQFDFSNLMGYYDMFADALVRGNLHIAFTPDKVNLVDMIPYQGRYYLQWGPVPVLFHLMVRPLGLTLSDRVACVLAGWLTSLVFLEIMLLLQRRYFPHLPRGVSLWFFLGFALGTPAALVTYRGTIYSESIAIASLAVLLGFLGLLRYQENESPRWTLLCGACIAAALTTRVTMALYGGIFFLALAFLLWRRKRSLNAAVWALGLFVLPVVLGVVVMLGYNQARFGSPFDYGNSYKPGASSHYAPFSLLRVPENMRHYLFSLPTVSADFPWIDHSGSQPLRHTSRAEAMSSLLLGSAFLVLAGLSWRVFRSGSGADLDLKTATVTAAAGGGLMFAVMLLFSAASRRYAHDFVPMFMVLAFIGVATLSEPDRLWRRFRPVAWGVLAFSALLHAQIAFYQSFHTPTPDLNVIRTFVALNPLVRGVLPGPQAVEQEAIARNDLGTIHLRAGRHLAALREFEKASELLPESERIRRNLELARRLSGQQ